MPLPYVFIIADNGNLASTTPDTGSYQMGADGTMTLEIVDDVFVAAPQTFTVPPGETVVIDFVVTRVQDVFANGFE